MFTNLIWQVAKWKVDIKTFKGGGGITTIDMWSIYWHANIGNNGAHCLQRKTSNLIHNGIVGGSTFYYFKKYSLLGSIFQEIKTMIP